MARPIQPNRKEGEKEKKTYKKRKLECDKGLFGRLLSGEKVGVEKGNE